MLFFFYPNPFNVDNKYILLNRIKQNIRKGGLFITEYREISDEEIQEIRDELKDNLFIVEGFMETEDSYNETFENLYGYMIRAFEVKEIREHPLHFKFKKSDEYIHALQIRRFITNIILWKAFLDLDAVDALNEDCIIDCTKISNRVIKDFLDNKIVIPYKRKTSNKKLCRILSEVIDNLTRISNDFNIIMGMSINIETFMDVANKNPEYDRIIRTKIDENMQPTEIEVSLENLRKREIEILTQEENLLRPMLLTGSGINVKQLGEFSINGGLDISPAV